MAPSRESVRRKESGASGQGVLDGLWWDLEGRDATPPPRPRRKKRRAGLRIAGENDGPDGTPAGVRERPRVEWGAVERTRIGQDGVTAQTYATLIGLWGHPPDAVVSGPTLSSRRPTVVRKSTVLLLSALVMAAIGGCQRSPTQVAPSEPPSLPVSKAVAREIVNYAEFTGRTEAVEAVDVRPRVTGYLTRIPFKEGSEVKKGDLLFEIDPRPYQAQLDQANGQVNLYKAQMKLAQINYARDQAISARVQGSISQQQLDQDVASIEEATARVKAYEAYTEVYKLNLEFTKVSSPIDGLISRYYLTVGNLVNQDQTLLTTVVSLDPMYVYFDMDEPTLLRLRKARNSGEIKPTPAGQYPVLMGLQGEEGFNQRGTINFVNNQVNPATGSITLRGVFANPKAEGGTRLLSPGMFVRVRLPIGQPHRALLIIDRAVGSDQGQKFVYVVDSENKVQYRRVTTGALQEDGLREIAQGLKADDWVLVGGLQQARLHMPIRPEPRAMPTLSQPSAGAADGQEPQAPGGARP